MTRLADLESGKVEVAVDGVLDVDVFCSSKTGVFKADTILEL